MRSLLILCCFVKQVAPFQQFHKLSASVRKNQAKFSLKFDRRSLALASSRCHPLMSDKQQSDASNHVLAAKNYVEMSNKHLVDECIKLMHFDAEYESSAVGGYKGVNSIREMMTSYFSKFPNVHWDVKEYVHSGNCVSFEFLRTGCTNAEGKPVTAYGKEDIHFLDGEKGSVLISKIRVETLKTTEND
jgi:hypothetical protein